jgi:hypothetical protein
MDYWSMLSDESLPTENVEEPNNTTVNKSIRIEYQPPGGSWNWYSDNAPWTDTDVEPLSYPSYIDSGNLSASHGTKIRVVYGDAGGSSRPYNMALESDGSTEVTLTQNGLIGVFEILPSISITATDNTAVENGDYGTFRVTRTGSTSSALTVYFSTTGSTATGPSPSMDYVLAGESDLGWYIDVWVTLEAGNSEESFDVQAWNDYDEPEEYVILNVKANSAYAQSSAGSATVGIQDTDP